MVLSWLDLPIELVIRILSFLHVSDLTSCMRTNKSLSQVIKDSTLLQYIFETQVAGVEDNPNSKYSLSERLRVLRNREEAWSCFRNDFTERIHVAHNPSGIYDVTGGIYLLGDSASFRRTVTTALNYVTLPTLSSHRTRWSRIDIHRNIVDIGLAIYEHDLIVIITFTPVEDDPTVASIELVLLSFSTGSPHPAARHPTILVNKSNARSGRPAIGIEIVGDHLALVTSYLHGGPFTPDRFYVFDWKRGTLLLEHTADHSSYSGVVFLSMDVFLLPNTSDETLELWRIPISHSESRIEKVHALGLPELALGRYISFIACRGEPTPRGGYLSSTHPPFWYSPEDSIINFNIRIQEFQQRSFSFVVHRRALLSAIPANSGHSPDVGVAITPWAEWGPPITRWFNADDVPTRWITTAAGQRCVLITVDAVTEPAAIVIFDFNPYHVRYRQSRPDLEKIPLTWSVTGATSFAYEGIFMEPVESFLPYVACASREEFSFDGVLIDEERVLGICTDDDRNVISIDALHFG